MAKAYEMEMMFSVSVGFKQINDMMAQLGFNDKLQIQDAVTVSVKQVLPSIPDWDYLSQVADLIKENYRTNDLDCTACHFTGYKYLREITVKENV